MSPTAALVRVGRARAALTGVAAGLALLALLALAAPSDAAVRKFDLGVYADSFSIPEDLDRMRDARTGSLRVPFNWARIEQRTGSNSCVGAIYDWGEYDRLFHAASDRRIRLIPVIIGSPRYAAARQAQAPHTRSPAINDYRCFVRALAQRYGRGGMQTNLGGRAIKEWQVWNETNLDAYAANGKPNPREYARFLKLTHREITRADRKANIVLAGLPELTGAGMNLEPYLRKLYRVKRIKSKFDAVAIHPYATNHRGVDGALTRLRSQLDRLRDRRRAIWVTEIGWSTHVEEGTTFNLRSEQGQAAQLRKTFKLFERKRRSLHLGTNVWFRWSDRSGTGSNGAIRWMDSTGLLRRNGSSKPACSAFASFTDGFCANRAGQAGSDTLRTPGVDVPAAAEALRPSPAP